MYTLIITLSFLLAVFVGYFFGRVGHVLGGHTKSPHHWLYGAGMIVTAFFFRDIPMVPYMALMGAGVFVSDLKDFLELKIYGVDEVEVKRFWGID